ncbi:MAG: c-type cytochrome, partial [Pirellulales bacterium]
KLTTKEGEILPPIAELVALAGDPGRGEAVYKNTQGANCIACHQIGNQGEMIGPPLNTIGDKLNREQLLEAILFPSKAILMGYENWAVETTAGEVFTGLKDADTPDRVTIKDISGQYHDIPAEQVADKIMLQASVMPEASNTMTQQELLDLVAYLATLKKAE